MQDQSINLGNGRGFGYAGNAAHEAAEDARFEGYVANIGTAQAVNQNTMQQIVARHNMQAGQISQLQHQ